MRMGTAALETTMPWPGVVEGPETWEPHTLKKLGPLATMPRLIWELTTLRAPPGLTVTGPTTRALVSSTLSPALTVTGPRRSPVMVRVGVGATKGAMTTDSLAAPHGEVTALLAASPP